MQLLEAMQAYRPQHKPNQLLCGSGRTAIATGWTVKQAVAKHLDTDEYAVIGQLYSPTRGISLLVRNLLLNPQVRDLVLLDATREDRNAGGVRCLADFFENGFQQGTTDTGRECWLVKSEVIGYVDIEIPGELLEGLRHAVTCHRTAQIKEAVALVKQLAQKPPHEPWTEPQDFPLPRVASPLKPGRRYGHRIEGATIAETWVKIIHRIRTTGTIRPTQHDSQWQELIDLVAVVTDEPRGFAFPEPNYLPVSPEFVENYISQVCDDAPQMEGVKYTYGQRLRSHFGLDQVEQVMEKLARDPDSARSVMSLWDAAQDGMGNSSPPCLNHIWTRIVDGELSMTATFRSNDMFGAWVANAMGLRALQEQLLDEISRRSGLQLRLGALITVSQSAHIYDDCWENADDLIRVQYPQVCQKRTFFDPSGSFTIAVSDGEIVVEHLTPGTGESVNYYTGKNARSLYQQIATDCPALEAEHALYLGTELQKAELCVAQGWVYEQDKPLKIS